MSLRNRNHIADSVRTALVKHLIAGESAKQMCIAPFLAPANHGSGTRATIQKNFENGVTLSCHDEVWRDAHRDGHAYHWHDAGRNTDWHHGYRERSAWRHID